MPSFFKPDWAMSSEARDRYRAQQREIIRLRGPDRPPNPPRSVIAQGGNAKAVVTWSGDPGNPSQCKTRIYKNTESGLYAEIPAGVHWADVSGTPGTTINIFVSTITPTGLAESRKIHKQCSIPAQTVGQPPPPDPNPPAGWSGEPSGGGGKSGSGFRGGYSRD